VATSLKQVVILNDGDKKAYLTTSHNLPYYCAKYDNSLDIHVYWELPAVCGVLFSFARTVKY
jgi:hypothetical protein